MSKAELTLYEGGALDDISEPIFFQELADIYIELQEASNRRVRLEDAVWLWMQKHPDELAPEVVSARAESKQFSDYLVKRRKAHLVEKTVPSILAAEAGVKLGVRAAEILLDRMDTDALAAMEDRDLINLMKAGFELAHKADKAVEAVTGTKDIQVNVDLRGLLMGLTPEQAQEYMAEAARRIVVGGK